MHHNYLLKQRQANLTVLFCVVFTVLFVNYTNTFETYGFDPFNKCCFVTEALLLPVNLAVAPGVLGFP